MTCKLCLKEDVALRDSHIVPSALHKELKDNSGKNVRFELPGKVTVKNQRDLKEYMLCDDCEGLFSAFEKRSMELLRPLWKNANMGRKARVIPAISTTTIQKFAHSVFWRASVSTILPKYKLSEVEEETLRNSLLNDEPILPPSLAVRLDFFSDLRHFGSANVMQSPGMFKIAPGIVHSAFVAMGIIFSMQSPEPFEILFNVDEFLTPGEDYTIRPAPEIIAAPCNAALLEIERTAIAYGRNSSKN